MTRGPRHSLFESLQRWFRPATLPALRDDASLQAAVAGLLVEVMRADMEIKPAERRSIATLLTRSFDIDSARAQRLIDDAELDCSRLLSTQPHTVMLNESANGGQKRELVLNLYRAAWADGELHALEELLIERVATALKISARACQQVRAEAARDAESKGFDPAP